MIWVSTNCRTMINMSNPWITTKWKMRGFDSEHQIVQLTCNKSIIKIIYP